MKLVPAWHTNTTPDGTAIGSPAGLVVQIDGVTVYHLGDTALFGDMRLIGDRYSPDIALVPIGGHEAATDSQVVLLGPGETYEAG